MILKISLMIHVFCLLLGFCGVCLFFVFVFLNNPGYCMENLLSGSRMEAGRLRGV